MTTHIAPILLLAVPTNRMGHQVYSALQLKTISAAIMRQVGQGFGFAALGGGLVCRRAA